MTTPHNPYASMVSLLPSGHHLSPPPSAARPILHLTGVRNNETAEVTVRCRCVGFPTYSQPIIALFVCRDVHSERDRFSYLGQTQPTAVAQYQDLECVFKIADCPAPPKAPPIDKQKEEDACILALAGHRLVDPSVSPHPVTQLKLNVYQTNTASAAGGFDGGLQMQDLLGTGLVDLERLLEEKQGEERPVGVSIEMRGPNLPGGGSSSSYGVSSPQYSSAISSAITSSSGTPQYTTLRIPHQIPPVGAHSYASPRHSGNGLTMLQPGVAGSSSSSSSSAAAAASSSLPVASVGPQPGLYGITESAVRDVFHTPTIATAEEEDAMTGGLKAEWERRQVQEAARLQAKGLQPIDAREMPDGGRYAMGDSKSESLLAHRQNNSRMCGGSADDGCSVM